ncbi:hypothetical protein [Candidatus Cardinium hertigii]|jgi:hypothetical protein|uniref:Uncharacterized protein n=1 Tax=Candidatus Cardinium hertigii TaxID=247481 RepID=A0A3N2QAV2_9BACT|nr:hypothetical protein [Candidatus Cardinium hertigii]ROT46923.1 hypothetical protein EDM02_05085 [Candidatus Cardinium hertigii]
MLKLILLIMPIKINELIIQIKVYETNKKVENPNPTSLNFLLHTEQQKLALTKDVLNLLEDRETR